MQHAEPNSIEFKYKWHDESGAATSFRNGMGSFNGTMIRLGNLSIDVAELSNLVVQESVFFFRTSLVEHQVINVEIYGTDVQKLEFAIHASRSAMAARHHREQLSQAGRLTDYRDSICPFCHSTIVLTGLPTTPQVFCEYCNTLHTVNQSQLPFDESQLRICDGCGMYAHPREFAIFYFYFLVVTFGFHFDTTNRCTACMRRSAWKMVIGNLFGVLSLPFALWQLLKTYRSNNLPIEFTGLDDANLLAIKRKVGLALEKYDIIMDNVPENAGVKYNIAAGFTLVQDFENAAQMFELSLDDCSNYWPSVHGLVSCLHKLGKEKELAAVNKLWGLDNSNDFTNQL